MPDGDSRILHRIWVMFLVALSGILLVACNATKTDESTPPVIDQSPAIERPDVAGQRIIERNKIEPPAPAPDFELTNRTGETVSLGSLRGKTVLMSFIYTNCPEACPLLPGAYVQLQETFNEQINDGEFELMFITTDPARDTTEKIQRYTKAMGGEWLFLTGEEADLTKVWREYDIYREIKERNREIVVYHSYKLFLIDKDGMLRYQYTGIWTAADLAPDVREVLSGTTNEG